jgi:hypothetical protein
MQGGFFAGSYEAVVKFKHFFWERHRMYIDQYFIGKDQEIMNSLAMDSELKVAYIPSFASESQYCGDIWFYFYRFLGYPEDIPTKCKILKLKRNHSEYTQVESFDLDGK